MFDARYVCEVLKPVSGTCRKHIGNSFVQYDCFHIRAHRLLTAIRPFVDSEVALGLLGTVVDSKRLAVSAYSTVKCGSGIPKHTLDNHIGDTYAFARQFADDDA